MISFLIKNRKKKKTEEKRKSQTIRDERMLYGDVPIEPGIYCNFCAKLPNDNEICGVKIDPGAWEYKVAFMRNLVYYHPKRKTFRTLISAGPFLIVADMMKYDVKHGLYITTIYDNYVVLRPEKYMPFFEAEYRLHGLDDDTISLGNIIYDGECIYLQDMNVKFKAPHLGELLKVDQENLQIIFSHGKVTVTDRIIVKWLHDPKLCKPPLIAGAEIITWY